MPDERMEKKKQGTEAYKSPGQQGGQKQPGQEQPGQMGQKQGPKRPGEPTEEEE